MTTLEQLRFLDKALDSYEYFFRYWVWPNLNPGSELAYSEATQFMLELAQAFYQGEHRLCTLAVPPRNTKTSIFTIGLPVWMWLKNPSLDILTQSASEEVIKDFDSDRSGLYETTDFKQFWQLLYGKELKNKDPNIWPTKSIKVTENPLKGKHYQWTNKSRTGLGFNYGISDDPIANSDAKRRSVCERVYEETMAGHLSRRHDKKVGQESPYIVVQQRLSEGDLIGRLTGKESWEHFSLPAIATDSIKIYMPLSGVCWERKAGDVLNPGREDLATLLKIQSGDLRLFQTQYQQSPDADTSDAMIVDTDIQYYDERQPEYEEIIMSVDSASTTNKGSSNWGIEIMGKYGKMFDVLFAHAKQYNYPDGKAKVLELQAMHDVDVIYVEDKSTGSALIPELEEMKAKGKISCKIVAVKPGVVPKEERFIAAVPYLTAMCRFPRLTSLPGEVWVMLVLRELVGFPNCPTRDLADCLSQYFYHHYAKKVKRKNLGRFYGIEDGTGLD